MIYSISCDKPSFKNVYFKEGFNVILAERTKESTDKDSRNGLGKSTLIEIIHFCLGGNKGETLCKEQLKDWTFTIELDLLGKKYSISRNTASANKIYIIGDCIGWPIKPEIDRITGKQIISRTDWTKALGVMMFDVQTIYDEYNYHPSFRSLISYFIRKNGHSGAFLNPFQQHKNQQEWDTQINNSFLLGLGWEYASKLQVLKDREKLLKQIKQETTTGILSSMIGNIGELEATRIRLEAQVKQEEDAVNSFHVHPQYYLIEQEANNITKQIHNNINQSIDYKRLLEHYQESIKEEIDAKPEQVEKVYKEAGLVLSDNVKRNLSEVLVFHNNIVKNRKEYLSTEINNLKQKIINIENEIEILSSKRADLFLILKTHGALEEYTKLQSMHQSTVSQLNEIKTKLDNLKTFEEGKNKLVIDQALLVQKANKDLNERQHQKETAILTFNEYSKALYEAPGILSINIKDKGYIFNVDIKRSGSHGINNMKIFCYDLMLAKLWSKKIKSPPILMHDSILFADVDERQKALALQLAYSESKKHGYQYICTMNSDAVPYNEFDDNFIFNQYIALQLTDATDDGGLLGIRF